MDAVVLEEVSKSFGAVRAVDALSARVPAGTIYGLLGPNGAGKTTTMRMIMDIISPDSGRVEILGGADISRARERIGYMPEERGLYAKMKVGAMLRFMAALKGLSRADAAGETDRWLEAVGLAESGARRVEELSKGNQQKLQFAVTAIGQPDILILDEPFAGLDPVNLEVLKDIMLRLRDAGKTVVFSTHMMDQAQRLCDVLLLINNGAKVVEGNLEEIRSRYQSNTVVAELAGETDFVERLPIAKEANMSSGKMEILLEDGADEQELLKALLGRCRVKAFQLKAPSLHEIFVHLVGTTDA